MNELKLSEALSKLLGTDIVLDLNKSDMKGEKDLFSEIYEKSLDKDQRKKFAQFFTHKELVSFILKNVPISKDSFVLDPACGAGAFLLEAYNNGVNLENIYGVDIDPVVINLAALNLEHASKEKIHNLLNLNSLKDCQLSLFPKVLKNGGFDIVIGNPPFQNLKKKIDYDEKDPLYSEVLAGIANSAALMIAKGYELLKNGGYLGFVLPKNIIRVDSFKSLRKFLIHKTKIIKIFDLDHYFKDVRGDQIIIILQKKIMSVADLKSNNVEILIHQKKGDFTKPYSYYIPQDIFLKYRFLPVFYKESIIELADRFFNYKTTLESISDDIFRGLGISSIKTKTYEFGGRCRVVYRGDCIQRFGIKYVLYLDESILKGSPTSKVDRLQKEKIILQNLCSKEGGIFAALANKNELTLDTVTNVTVTKYNIKYILAVLNSRISNFFIIFLTFLNSNFTMHMDKEYIGRIPIVIPSLEKQNQVIEVTNRLLEIRDKYSKQFFKEYEVLNNLLYDIYELSEKERKTINNLLREVMSVRQNGGQNE